MATPQRRSNVADATLRSAAQFIPHTRSLAKLQAAAQHCQGCDLYRQATQTVFGQGVKASQLMLVGETPGDQEDLAGAPFVGPAGRLLDEVLAEVGVDRRSTYVTDIVKHFKWTPRGKRRLHAKPSSREVAACRPWLEAEIAIVRPEVLVCLGATAAQGLLGKSFRISRQRGKVIPSPWAAHVLSTYHPSAILRAPDDVARRKMRRLFASDLRRASQMLTLPARDG